MKTTAKVFKMDRRDGRSQGWFDPPNRGPYDYQSVKPATAAIMTDDRKGVVQESAEEFKLDGLWGEDWNAGEQAVEMEIQDW